MTVEQMQMSAWLNRAYFVNNKVNALISERDRNVELATKITPPYNDTGASKSVNNDNSSEIKMLRICEMNEKINNEINRLTKMRQEIKQAIDSLQGNDNSDLDAVLRMHYLGYMTWEQVAEEMNIDRSTAIRKYRKALQKLIDNAIECHS